MSRGVLLAGGLVLLGVAALLRTPPADHERGTLEAVGASMGGMRVVVIDGLFVRAESLRRLGRLDDAAGLYHAILELDPGNQAATIFLADLFVDGMLPGAVDAASRFQWWREARGVLTDALARTPDAPALHDRAASLIVRLPMSQADLETRLVAELGNWRMVALRHLAVAFEATDVLPRRGRGHVRHAALLAPDVAARALHAGDTATFTEALALGRRLQAVRADALGLLTIDTERSEPLGFLLAASLDALEATAAVRAGAGEAATAEAAIERVETLEPRLRLPRLLREVLDAPR